MFAWVLVFMFAGLAMSTPAWSYTEISVGNGGSLKGKGHAIGEQTSAYGHEFGDHSRCGLLWPDFYRNRMANC